MIAPILIALLLVPIAELFVIVQIAGEIGVVPTLLLLVVVSVAGAWLLKQQGMATWRRLQETLARGEMPTSEVVDGAMILFGGALLLTPGFLTDAVGLLLLLPPTRASLKGAARRLFKFLAFRRLGLAGEVGRRAYETRVVKVERSKSAKDSGDRPEERPPQPLSEAHPDDADGSPDRG